jgi:hypothetical protein
MNGHSVDLTYNHLFISIEYCEHLHFLVNAMQLSCQLLELAPELSAASRFRREVKPQKLHFCREKLASVVEGC